MNTETMPAPTFFEKLLTISGGPWYTKFLSRVVVPIRYHLGKTNDPALFLAQIQASGVRAASRETGIEGYPRMLASSEPCPMCNQQVLLFVQPQRVCFECWPDAFDSTNHTLAESS